MAILLESRRDSKLGALRHTGHICSRCQKEVESRPLIYLAGHKLLKCKCVSVIYGGEIEPSDLLSSWKELRRTRIEAEGILLMGEN